MSVNYEQLKKLVIQELADGPGGVMAPSGPGNVPHRMPAAEPSKEEGDPEANKMYDIALAAREATEGLVEALDAPIFDDAYEQAFKASACLRRALNSLIESGAAPALADRVVAPPAGRQKFSSFVPYADPSLGYTDAGHHAMAEGISDLSPFLRSAINAFDEAMNKLEGKELELFKTYMQADPEQRKKLR